MDAIAIGLFEAAMDVQRQEEARCYADMQCFGGILQEEVCGTARRESWVLRAKCVIVSA